MRRRDVISTQKQRWTDVEMFAGIIFQALKIIGLYISASYDFSLTDTSKFLFDLYSYNTLFLSNEDQPKS